jgi:hypothetical protein
MIIHAYHGDTHKPVLQVHPPQNPYCIYAAVVSTSVARLSQRLLHLMVGWEDRSRVVGGSLTCVERRG